MIKISLLVISLLGLPREGDAEPLRMLISDKYEMPLAEIKNDQITAGMLFDLGHAIAQQLGRTVIFIPLPRKRLAMALEAGQADLVCNQNPAWFPGPFDWTNPFIPHTDVLISDQKEARPQKLADLANIRIGTTLGFSYPDMSAALGSKFIRDDSLTARSNLLKLNAGHVHHIIIDQYVFEYQQKLGKLQIPVHPYLLISKQPAACAVSRKGQIPIAALNQAIAELDKRAKLKPIFLRYR